MHNVAHHYMGNIDGDLNLTIWQFTLDSTNLSLHFAS